LLLIGQVALRDLSSFRRKLPSESPPEMAAAMADEVAARQGFLRNARKPGWP
jgi:hypothetical protein